MGKKSRERDSGLPLGLYFRIKGFQALSFIGISHQNIKIIVSMRDYSEVQRCHVRQNPVPQWQQPEIANLVPNVNPSLSDEEKTSKRKVSGRYFQCILGFRQLA